MDGYQYMSGLSSKCNFEKINNPITTFSFSPPLPWCGRGVLCISPVWESAWSHGPEPGWGHGGRSAGQRHHLLPGGKWQVLHLLVHRPGQRKCDPHSKARWAIDCIQALSEANRTISYAMVHFASVQAPLWEANQSGPLWYPFSKLCTRA